ncbi:MAG: transposase family protein [Sandaracinobacter sp.]
MSNAVVNPPLPRLTSGDRIVHCDRVLFFQRDLGEGLLDITDASTGRRFLVQDPDDGQTSMPSADWLMQEMAAGRIKIQKPRRLGDRVIPMPPIVELEIDDAQGAERLRRIEALRKLRWLREMDRYPNLQRSDASLAAFIAKVRHLPELADLRPPHPSTLRRWYNKRGVPGERHAGDMSSGRGRFRRLPTFDPLILKVKRVWVARYWADARLSMKDAYSSFACVVAHLQDRQAGKRRLRNGLMVARSHPVSPLLVGANLSCPSRETFRRAVQKEERRATYEARYGTKAAEDRYRTTKGHMQASQILERVTLDHTTIDAFCIIDTKTGAVLGRPTICVLVDAYSSCPIGWFVTFEPPSHFTVIEAIRRANRPKIQLAAANPAMPELKYLYGRPSTLVVDNALENTSGSFRDAMMEVGIAVEYAPPGQPRWKGSVERIHLTLRKLLSERVPGGIQGTVDERRQLGIHPEAEAMLDIATLDQLIGQAIATYVYEPHRTMKMAPMKRWIDSATQHGIDFIPDENVLDQITGRAKICQLNRNGVQLHGLCYNDHSVVARLLDVLVPRTKKRRRPNGSAVASVKVKYNPANISEIHVFDEVSNEYLTMPCTDRSYTKGLSLWSHQRVIEFAKLQNLRFSSERERHEARRLLREKIDEAAPGLRGKRRTRALRILDEESSRLSETDVIFASAEPRHDGNGPVVVPHDTLEKIRTDGGRVPPTPRRGRKTSSAKRDKVSKSQSAARSRQIPSRVSSVGDKDKFLNSLDW